MFKEVKDRPGLVRDTKTNAIIYVDKNIINRKKEANKAKKAQSQNLVNLQQQVESLQNEIGDIKQLLIKMVEK
tara:strand:- start:388 stop:606 length:219 start_codon:yes stop_codon:yes gene_type:complete